MSTPCVENRSGPLSTMVLYINRISTSWNQFAVYDVSELQAGHAWDQKESRKEFPSGLPSGRCGARENMKYNILYVRAMG